MVRVVLADDHPVARMGLRSALTTPGSEVVAEAESGLAAIEAFRAHRPDVLVLDLRLPDLDAVEVLRRLRAESFAPRAIVLTAHAAGEHARRVLEAGGLGFLSKSACAEEIRRAVASAAEGRRFIPEPIERALAEARAIKALSAREREVLVLMVEGRTNREIGVALALSETTVRTHVLHLLEKLGVSDRTAAATLALRLGLVD